MTPRFGVVAALLACAACGHGTSAPEPPRPAAGRRPPPPAPPPSGRPSALDALLRDDLAADSAFPWSATRRLTWRDFRGRPPAEGEEVAKTAYTLFYAWKCSGEAFDFRVVAGFRPRQSWVKTAVLNDTTLRRTTLRHEQTHFDLAEVHARRMRGYFDSLAGACRKSDRELTALAKRLIDEAKAEQQQYDAETEHGIRSDRQTAWTDEVARRLGGGR